MLMFTNQIPKGDWIAFFDEFSKRHQGWNVLIEEIGADLGDQEDANQMPFVGITADLKDREDSIAIIVGGKTDADVNRFIKTPKRVWFRHSPLEQYDAIELESEEGTKTVLQFRFVPVEQAERQLEEHAR